MEVPNSYLKTFKCSLFDIQKYAKLFI
uniref:Uncharacterized protein n=1 Tax=Rhizophora mucronata TaxID=61149 RepID=A0A2P2QM56_RHIMU